MAHEAKMSIDKAKVVAESHMKLIRSLGNERAADAIETLLAATTCYQDYLTKLRKIASVGLHVDDSLGRYDSYIDKFVK